MEEIKKYHLSAEAMVMISGSSIGTQRKFYDNGYWYKQNNAGYEGAAEYIASVVLKYSNIDSYVEYEQCQINDKMGCRSLNFLKEGESFISLQRMYDIYQGGQLSERIRLFNNISERIAFVLDFVKDYASLDLEDYLSKMLAFDMLILNTDRHFNNIGIIANSKENTFRTAPVFDNGNSLLSNVLIFPLDEPLEENISKAVGQPFSANLELQAYELGFGLKLDYNSIENALAKEPASRALDIIRLQMNKYEKYFRKD